MLRPITNNVTTPARYIYVYAVALHSAGRSDEAMKVLKDGLAKRPDNRGIVLMLMALSRDARDLASALECAEHLARLAPDDHDLARLVEELRRKTKKSQEK